MSRWMRAIGSIALLVLLFLGINQSVLNAETEGNKRTPHCETIDEEAKSDMEMLLEMFQAGDIDALTDRLNELSTSTALLEDELDVLEIAICLDDVYTNSDVHAGINVYHSFVTFALQMEEDIQFEEIIVTPFYNDAYIQVEGKLKDMDENVRIDHYYAFRSPEAYGDQERRLKEEEERAQEETPLILSIANDLASHAYAIFQNPMEKFMGTVDSFFTDKAELEEEVFERESRINAGSFNMSFSLITFGEDKWEPLNMVEYYPSISTVPTIERMEEVLEELPDYWYPTEEIERGDWNGVIAYFEKHHPAMIDYDRELYGYIFGNAFRDSRNFEELIERVKEEHQEK